MSPLYLIASVLRATQAWLRPVTKDLRKDLHFGNEIVLIQFSPAALPRHCPFLGNATGRLDKHQRESGRFVWPLVWPLGRFGFRLRVIGGRAFDIPGRSRQLRT